MAYQLHTPVYKLLEEMPFTELKGWSDYFSKYPVGWRDDRRALIISQSMGAKIDAKSTFPSLAAVERANNASSPLLGESLRKSPWMHLLENAKGGDHLE